MNPISRFCACVLVAVSAAGCASTRPTPAPEPAQPAVRYIEEPCWEIWAKHCLPGGEEKLFGPFYSEEMPQTIWPNGDTRFLNMDTGRYVLIPGGAGWSVHVSPHLRRIEMKPHQTGL